MNLYLDFGEAANALLSNITKGAWKEHWLNLLQALHTSVPADWFVLVMADRGLYAKWLYREIVHNGWHPFLRIKQDGAYRPQGESSFRSLVFAAPRVGTCWTGHVTCFRMRPLDCTLLARWDEPHTDPWLIVTDLPGEQADVCWYAMRAWIEAGFKDTKRGGWHWNHTRIADPKRSERHWLAIAVATLWAVSVGGEADATLPESSIDELPELHIARKKKTKEYSRPRLISCFRRGVLVILVRLIAGQKLRLGRFYPEPWPTSALATDSG